MTSVISPSKFKNAISVVGEKIERHSDGWKARMKYRLFHGGGQEPMKILVAVPAYNEEVAIGSVVLRSLKYADEVMVIDDGSADNTAEVAALAGAKVVKHEKNGGYGAAIRTCFDNARKAKVDIMIIIDADGQHSPDDIPKMVEEMVSAKSDIVIGSRFVDGNEKNQKIPAYRKFGMKVLDTATVAGSGLNISDSQSGFRAYSKKAIDRIRIGEGGMGAGSEILIEAADQNLKISEVPIKVRYDLKGTSSKNPVAHGLSVLNSIVGFMSQKKPMLFFGIPGLVLLDIGVLACFEALRIFNLTDELPIGHLLVGVVGITLGTQCIFTGFVLISIKSITTRLARQSGNRN
ncbi:MAG TPA: glycosyltransferase family 2 protein [Methanocella sp.]|jgi:glycosyltransferase involved in cell wall biosynthesis